MMLTVRLEACSADQRHFRAYELTVCPDLFGCWIVERTYGRIGRSGRTLTKSFSTREEARGEVKACLDRRASAPRRIGVAYELLEVTGFADSRISDLEELRGALVSW